MSNNRRLLKKKTIPGTIKNFNAQMRQLFDHLEGCWESPNGARLRFEEYPRTTPLVSPNLWLIWIPSPLETVIHEQENLGIPEVLHVHEADGCIKGYELSNGVVVEFWDGESPVNSFCEPIGPIFESFCDWLIDKLEEEKNNNLPPVTDPTDQRILEWVTKEPDLKDQAIGQRLGLSRQAVNNRRQRLKAMGYIVR